MATTATVKVPKVAGNTLTWFPLPAGATYKNVGMNAEIGYSAPLAGAPTVLKGEIVLQNETIDQSRGEAYVLQDAYFSYEFMVVG